MFTASGTLRYSPQPLNREPSEQRWWLILDCDPEIGRYYRRMYERQHNYCRKLQRPFWGPHITILRNEEPDDAYKHLWNAHAGETVEFQYSGGVSDNYSPERYRSFYWLDVVCPRFDEIRQELGLADAASAWSGTDYHLTIGNWENPDRKEWFLNEFRPPQPE